MGEPLGHIKVFPIACYGIGIGQYLIHTTVLCMECLLHLGIGESDCQVNRPIAEA